MLRPLVGIEGRARGDADDVRDPLQVMQRRTEVEVLKAGRVREQLCEGETIGEPGRVPEPLHHASRALPSQRLDQLAPEPAERAGRQQHHPVVLQPDATLRLEGVLDAEIVLWDFPAP